MPMITILSLVFALHAAPQDSKPSLGEAPPAASTPSGKTEAAKANARIAQLIGPELKRADGSEVKTKDVLDGRKNVALYFSASWCPPCRTFTPKLITFANEHVGNEEFVVILVGSDRSKAQHLNYFKKFGSNFYAVPYDKQTLGRIQRAYAGGGIPNLVILAEDGSVVKGSYEKNGKYSPRDRRSYIGPNPVLAKLAEMYPTKPAG